MAELYEQEFTAEEIARIASFYESMGGLDFQVRWKTVGKGGADFMLAHLEELKATVLNSDKDESK